jgi:hypothetical protein
VPQYATKTKKCGPQGKKKKEKKEKTLCNPGQTVYDCMESNQYIFENEPLHLIFKNLVIKNISFEK